MTECYLNSGGFPGRVFEFMLRGSCGGAHYPYQSLDLADHSNQRAIVLRAIYTARADASSVDHLFGTTYWVAQHALNLRDIDESTLHDMVDVGLIRFQVAASGSKEIGFGNPLLFFKAALANDPAASVVGLAAQCFPKGPTASSDHFEILLKSLLNFGWEE